MPIYTYECDHCGHVWDALGTFDEKEKGCDRIIMRPVGDEGEYETALCPGMGKRIPSVPAPAIFNCSMPTYQRKKT